MSNQSNTATDQLFLRCDSKAVFAKRGKGTSATSGAMPTMTARTPGNVISVRLSPDSGQRR